MSPDKIPAPAKDGTGALHCSKCSRELPATVDVHQGRTVIRCQCGHATRVMRAPRPVEPRQRARMSKKDRKRLRAHMAADQERARQKIVTHQAQSHGKESSE